MIRQITKA